MKVSKKICIYFLVVVLCFCSVVLNYEKANSCKAVSLGVGVGLAVLGVGIILYGSYCVATDEELQNEVKQTFTDYKNMTVEGAKASYELNKQMFDNFISYVAAQGGSSALVYTSAGNTYTIDEMAAAGFPSFEKWDENMKKGSSSSGGFGKLLDKIMLGADILGLMKSFCNDEFYKDGINGQLFYTGDDGYFNKETGECNIYFEVRDYYNVDYDYNAYLLSYNANIGELGDFDFEKFKICAFVDRYHSYHGCGGYSCRHVMNSLFYIRLVALYADGGVGTVSIPASYNGADKGSRYECVGSFGTSFFNHGTGTYYGNTYVEELGRTLTLDDVRHYPDYISSNIPIFATWEEALSYFNAAGNVDIKNKLFDTNSDRFIDNYANTYITTTNVINDVNNYYNDDDGSSDDSNDDTTIVVTVTPFPTLPDDDGSNTTNNYIINITNILQPIQESITNIYNFFVIDTDRILPELDADFVPAEKFQKITEVASSLQASVPSDVHDESGVLAAEYPKITFQVPKILLDYVGEAAEEVDGKLVIVVCDFKDFALLFIRFRGFLAAVIWIGMIFYLLKQFEVTFSIS